MEKGYLLALRGQGPCKKEKFNQDECPLNPPYSLSQLGMRYPTKWMILLDLWCDQQFWVILLNFKMFAWDSICDRKILSIACRSEIVCSEGKNYESVDIAAVHNKNKHKIG